MSDTSARRKQRRAVSEQHVDSLARYTLRSDNCTARPSDEVGQRLMARVAATPRPVRPVVPPTPRWLLRWQQFMAVTPRMSARLSSMSAAALLMLLLLHSTLTALNPNGTPTLSFTNVRAAYDGLAVVDRQGNDPVVDRKGDDPVVVADTPLSDQIIEKNANNHPAAHTPTPQDAPANLVNPAPEPQVLSVSQGVTEPEDASTIVPPQSLFPNQPAIWPSVPDNSKNPYSGATVR